MRAAGIEGARRSKRVRTTKPDPAAARHPDLVNRDFTATAPNQLWVTDLTYVPTWAGVAYVCFIVDAYRRMIVGWRVASHMRTDDGPRRDRDGPLVTRHPTSRACGVTPMPGRSSRPCATANASPRSARALDRHRRRLATTTRWPRPSTATTRPSCIRGPARTGPWKTVDDVELATLGWVHWHNTSRLHGYLGDIPPAEFEAAFYAAQRTDQPLVEIQ